MISTLIHYIVYVSIFIRILNAEDGPEPVTKPVKEGSYKKTLASPEMGYERIKFVVSKWRSVN